MTKLWFWSDERSLLTAEHAAALDIAPSLWIRPKGEINYPTTGWITADDPRVQPDRLIAAAWWRINECVAAGHRPDRLIINHEAKRYTFRPGPWPQTPEQWMDEQRLSTATIRREFPWLSIGKWGLPDPIKYYSKPPHDLDGIQYVGAVTDDLDLACPCAYRKNTSDENLEAVRDRLVYAQTWRKPLHVFVSRYLKDGKVWTPLPDEDFRRTLEVVAEFDPESVELWSMVTRARMPGVDVDALDCSGLDMLAELMHT